MLPQCLTGTHKHGGGGLYVLWCFSDSGVGISKRLYKTVNAVNYQSVLKEALIPSMHALSPNITVMFQQDKGPAHTAKSIMQCLEKYLITTMSWPGESPDINPIENLSDDIGKK